MPEDKQKQDPEYAREPAQAKARRQPGQQAAPPPVDAPKPPAEVTLTIDGRSVTVPKGTLIVEAAKQVGIEIPVFCYHHKLDPVGACRMCLVEISPGPPRAQAGCITPVADGMTVKVTSSPMAVKARADILEFELANHPLDCPVCDKGGECPLQDYTFRHGYPVSRILDARLHFPKPLPISDNIALDRERCVLCYRCTRYYDEVTWEQELTVGQRGVDSYITTQFDAPLQSNVSGNIIDLCPVGALTSRVWRFQSRPWDMKHTGSVCSKCAVGCNVNLWERRGELMRVTSRENDQVDDGWLCDVGRFQYTEVNAPDRLQTPRINGSPASWDSALSAAAEGLRGMGERLGIALPRDITNEEAFLLRRLLDGPLKGARVVMENASGLAPVDPARQLAIEAVDAARTIVVVATDLRVEAPVVGLRVKKAFTKRGARLITVNHGEVDFDRRPGVEHLELEDGVWDRLAQHEALREGPVAIIYGGRGDDVSQAVARLAEATDARLMAVHTATNERGALALGILSSPGTTLEGCETVLLWGDHAVAPGGARFQVAWRARDGDGATAADVLLPRASWAEEQGSYTNLSGLVQFLDPPVRLEEPRRFGWEVLLDLAVALGVDVGWGGVFEIQRAAAAAYPELAAMAEPPLRPEGPNPVLLGAARP